MKRLYTWIFAGAFFLCNSVFATPSVQSNEMNGGSVDSSLIDSRHADKSSSSVRDNNSRNNDTQNFKGGSHFAEAKDSIKTYRMEEVVVSSSTKETNELASLPGSVSVVTSQVINNRQISSIKDLTSLVPNFYMPDYGSKLTSAVYIRGIGARSSGQSVGLYVDNAPYADKSSFDFEFADIAGIEVLRGPQGTLYGRNAMGGIINISTLSPLVHRGTKLSLSYGTYNTADIKFSHYGSRNGKLGYAVSGFYSRGDGFFKNEYTGEKIDNEESYGGSVRLAWRMGENWTGSYSLTAEHTDQGAFPYGLYDTETRRIAEVNINDESSYRRELLSNNLTFEYNTDKLLFTSTTGYQYLDDDMKMDQDFSPKSVFTLRQQQTQHAFSQEFSLRNRQGSRYRWSFGAYGFYNKMTVDAPVVFKEDGVKEVLQPVFDRLKSAYPKMPVLTITDNTLAIPGDFKTPAYGFAAYHQSTYNNLFVKGLSVTAGIRLDYERQRMDYSSQAKMHLSMTMPPMMPRPVDISDRYGESVVDESVSQDYWKTQLKFALNYEISSGASVYVSAAQGYKAGGYNVQMSADIMQGRMQYDIMNAFKGMMPDIQIAEPQNIKDAMSYRPESSWNYEAGFRGEFANGRAALSGAIFYMDVKDVQITRFVNSGNGRILSNAGRAESYGAELSVRAAVCKSLTADLNYGYTHATFRDYDNGKEDYKGNFIPYTPRHTLSVGLHYSRLLANCWLDQLFASAQLNGAGKIFWNEANDISQKFYTTLNANIGIRKESVTLSLWGRNITDTDFTAFYFESFGNKFMQKGKPVIVGIKLTLSF